MLTGLFLYYWLFVVFFIGRVGRVLRFFSTFICLLESLLLSLLFFDFFFRLMRLSHRLLFMLLLRHNRLMSALLWFAIHIISGVICIFLFR